MFDYERIRNDALALGLLALVVFVGLSFLSYDPADPPSDLVFPARRSPVNLCGSTGAAIAYYGRHLFGLGVWVAIGSLIAWDLRLLSHERTRGHWLTLAGTGLLLVSSCAALHVTVPEFGSVSTYGSGGMTGAWCGVALREFLSPAGMFILITCGLISGWMLSPLWHLAGPGVRVAGIPVALGTAVASLLKPRTRAAETTVSDDDDDEEPETLQIRHYAASDDDDGRG